MADHRCLSEIAQRAGSICRRTVRIGLTPPFKLSGTRGRDDWLAGLYLLRAPEHVLDGITPLGRSIIENDLTSYAAFAEYRFRPSDALTLTVGGRYSHDRFKGRNYSELPPNSPGVPQDVFPSDSRGRFDFKVGANYEISPTSLVYGAVQTGYIAAAFDQNGVIVKPSNLTSYTIGSKNRFFGGVLTANIEAFYYNYRDFQLQFNEGLVFGSHSVPARIMGAEVLLGLNPGRDDVFKLSALVQSAEIRERNNTYVRNGLTTSSLVSIYGYQLPYAPTVTLRASWDHTFRLPNDQRIVTQVSVLYSSRYWQSFSHDLYTDQPGYTKTDASVTYHSPGDRFSVGLFVRNAENRAVITGSSKSLGPGLTGAPYLQAPRTYGVSLGANF